MTARARESDVAALSARLIERLTGFMVTQAIYAITSLGVPDLLAEGPASAATLARRAGAHEQALHRFLRALAASRVVRETDDGTFELDELGHLLRSDAHPSLRDLVLYWGGEQTWRAWGHAVHSLRTGKPAFDHVFGTDEWTWFEAHPEESATFNGAMRGGAAGRALALRAYDWSGIERVVDVGGGNGATLIDLLSHEPHLRGVVVDRPSVAAEARERIAAAGLAGRCEAVAGDLFGDLPGGGDAYVLMIILHDWDVEDATRILASCRRAMPSGARLLVVENVLAGRAIDDLGKVIDLHMLVTLGGRERTEPEWRALLDAGGFRLERVLGEGRWSILEAFPKV